MTAFLKAQMYELELEGFLKEPTRGRDFYPNLNQFSVTKCQQLLLSIRCRLQQKAGAEMGSF